MEPQTSSAHKTTAKDFFLHLGSMIGLYSVAVSIINVLFTIINKAYPQVSAYNSYSYYSESYSISFPVATMIIMFPIFILLMWLLEKSYIADSEKKNVGIKKWLTYITLFVSGLVTAGDLVTIVYYFIDGQEITTGFVLKILSVLAISLGIFMYYISDVRDKLTHTSRVVWRWVACIVVLGTIITGFAVLGSPRTQQLLRYDEQKLSDLQQIDSSITSYFETNEVLPDSLTELQHDYSYIPYADEQTQAPYEYNKISDTSYELCTMFNQDSILPKEELFTGNSYEYNWHHPKGHFCFSKHVQENPNTTPLDKPVAVPAIKPYSN